MFKLGLKLWSTNKNYYEEALKLYGEGVYDYIELFAVPGSYKENISMWKNAKDKHGISFIIHAPHWKHGVNLARKDAYSRNIELIGESQKFADALKSEKLIVHPGVDGVIEETARQLKIIDDSRIIVENKPYLGLDKGLVCNGSTPDEIDLVMKTAGVGFCFDVGHAICSANSHRTDSMEYLRSFLLLKPSICHLSDGAIDAVYDDHKHIGTGSYDLRAVLEIIPRGTPLTIETVKDSKTDLNDFLSDINNLRGIMERECK